MAQYLVLIALAFAFLGCAASGDSGSGPLVGGSVEGADGSGGAPMGTDTGEPGGGSAQPPVTGVEELETCAKMDIVFVVDDSPSMREEQDNLAANLPQFVQVLDDYLVDDERPLDYRLAVLTPGRDVQEYITSGGTSYPGQASTGENGAFRQLCGMPRRAWAERGSTARSVASEGSMAAVP